MSELSATSESNQNNTGYLDTEARLQLAVKAIQESQCGKSGQPKLTISAAARIYDVKRGTLTNRLKGVKPRKGAHAHERALSEAEEEVLADWARTLGRRGYPVTLDMLGEYASVNILRYCCTTYLNSFMNRKLLAIKLMSEMWGGL